MNPSVLAAITSIITLVFIFDLLRRGVLREKYAVLWLFVGFLALAASIYPKILELLSRVLGVATPVNLLFFATIVLLILVAVQLSYELSRHEARIRRLAEELALQDQAIRELRERLETKRKRPEA
ncbi:MAG: DUF2304 family protein [Chloroflexi bacterium]|nr:DUF2304 family protein [Chloroflexota bacterium]